MKPATRPPGLSPTTFEFKGRHMAGVVGLFFGTIVAVNVVMAYLAVSTFPGLNAKNGYVASQTYDRLLAGAAEQAGRGWTSRMDMRDGRLAWTLLDADGRPVEGLDVGALVGRPASTRSDTEMALVAGPRGYVSPQSFPRGRWLAEIEARRNGALVWRETLPLTAD